MCPSTAASPPSKHTLPAINVHFRPKFCSHFSELITPISQLNVLELLYFTALSSLLRFPACSGGFAPFSGFQSSRLERAAELRSVSCDVKNEDVSRIRYAHPFQHLRSSCYNKMFVRQYGSYAPFLPE